MKNDKERLHQLENVLAQMLQPVRGIPLSVIIKSIAGHAVIPIDRGAAEDRLLIDTLCEAAKLAGAALRKAPIIRPRPNEVGNDVEAYVLEAIQKLGLECRRPTTASGTLKSTGYPDLLVTDKAKRPVYIECKIFASGSAATSMRSFYLSPSDNFKVTQDARHLLLAFEMDAVSVPGTRNSSFTAVSYKLVDLHDLLCDVKYEFNSDNRRLYAAENLLASGTV